MRAGGVAARANIENGDEIVSLFGNEQPTCAMVQRIVRSNDGKSLECTVRKPDGRAVAAYLTPQPPGSADATFSLIADDLLITGVKTLRPTKVDSLGDHRLAMTGYIAGFLASGETSVGNADCAEISYPTFYDDFIQRSK